MDEEQQANREREAARAAFRRRMRLLLIAPRAEVTGFHDDWRPVTEAIRDRHEPAVDEHRTPGIANL